MRGIKPQISLQTDVINYSLLSTNKDPRMEQPRGSPIAYIVKNSTALKENNSHDNWIPLLLVEKLLKPAIVNKRSINRNFSYLFMIKI